MAKLLFTVTEDWGFCSHRLPSAFAARDAGFEVVVAARMREHRAQIESLGFRAVPWNIRRESVNPFKELAALWDLIRIYRRERPDVTYHVAIKAIVYGSIAARLSGVKAVFNLFSGLGVVYISDTFKFKLIRAAATPILRWIMKPKNVFLQVHNRDDLHQFNAMHVSAPDRISLLNGSGLDTDNFPFTPEPEDGPVTAVCVSRLLWDKGIGELAEAARILRRRQFPLKIQLVGAPDPANPACIPEKTLRSWHDDGLLEWLGRRNDIADIFARSHIAVLPSYREGMPRSLLEGGSTGRPLVAFDAPGCRELIRDGENGCLVPFKDATALADALEKLATDKALRKRLGAQAHRDVEQTYSAEAIRKQLTAVFSQTLKA